MAISDIVNVQIVVQDASPVQPNFGRPLILGSAPFVGFRLYDLTSDGLAAMVTDGFTTADPVYRMVQTGVSQTPSTDKVVVYARTDAGATQLMVLTPVDTTEGVIYSFDVVFGTTVTPISFTVPAAATVASICTALQALVDAVTGVTSVDNTTHITIAPTAAGDLVQIDGLSSNATLADLSAAGNVATDLAAAAADPNLDFFGVAIDSYLASEISAAATFAEANEKIFCGQSADSDIWAAGSSDICSTLQASGLNNTYVAASRDMSGYFGFALMARQFSQDPGSSNWSYQRLSGPTADAWSASEFGFLQAKGAMTYTSTQSVSHTFGTNGVGKAVSGRSLSVTRGVAKLQSDIETNVLTTFLNAERIPYTSRGIAQLEAAVRAALSAAHLEDLRSVLPVLVRHDRDDLALRRNAGLEGDGIEQPRHHHLELHLQRLRQIVLFVPLEKLL